MTIYEFISSSGGTPDDNPNDFDIFFAASDIASHAKRYLISAAESNVYFGLFLPSDAAFIALAQQLGYPGDDEQAAMDMVLRLAEFRFSERPDARYDDTFLDEILAPHWILAFDAARQPMSFADIQELGAFTTIDGVVMGIEGTTLIDGAPSEPDPQVVPSNISVSNGWIEVVDRVLLAEDLPETSALGYDNVLAGSDGRDRLFGGDGDDLIIDGAGGDMLSGGAGADIFLLSGDGSRDKILDFDPGMDVLDLRHWNVRDLAELTINQRGETSLLIGDGRNSAVIQAAEGTIMPDDLGPDSFDFGRDLDGRRINGTDGRDRLTGTDGNDWIDGGLGRDFLTGGRGRDVFVAGTDTFDVILDFTEGLDHVWIDGWGVESFSELEIVSLRPWLLQVTAGDYEVRIRAADREIAADDLSAEDFLLPG